MRPNSNLGSSDSLTYKIKQQACSIGFDGCGITPAVYLEREDGRMRAWLGSGYGAGMSYLEKNGEKRSDPRILVENARSVIVVLINYYQDAVLNHESPIFSKYALGTDYHKVVKDKLYGLLDFIGKQVPGSGGRVFVDSAPVMERSLAVKAGLGWIGKNSMLISREHGSFTFIGEVITDVVLEYDTPYSSGHCDSCTRCIDSCPTNAILPDRSIDSNRCISYLTIEHRGEIPDHFHGKLNIRIFGCDICQDVCPWNSKAKPTTVKEFFIKPEIQKGSFNSWNEISEEEFNEIFNDSSVMRSSYTGFRRNLEFIKK